MATDHDPLDPRLADAIRGLEAREPAHDLWPGIARRIAPRRRTLQFGWPTAIAAGLALLAGGALVGRLTVVPGATSEPALATDTQEIDPGVRMIAAGFAEADASLADAIDRVEMAYLAAAPSLDDEARKAISSALVALDSAIVDARSRASIQPGDVDASRYLTRTMQRKLDVLQRAATLASRS